MVIERFKQALICMIKFLKKKEKEIQYFTVQYSSMRKIDLVLQTVWFSNAT